ncbi:MULTISPECIES: OmpA family protein [Roseomonadaceae]|nr:OmpA family protein [Roseomonas oleicola]
MRPQDLIRPLAVLLALAAGPALPGTARAQDAVPDVQRMIDGLDPARRGVRGIRVPSTPGPAEPDAAKPPVTGRPNTGIAVPDVSSTTAPEGAAAISLTVTFDTGSATLSPRATGVLDNLGQALGSSRLAGYRFRVEGHTDSVGDAAMNQALSERRAAAVRDFLVQRHGLDPGRIEVLGLGEQQLLVATPDGVDEPRNRRVQVVNLGG